MTIKSALLGAAAGIAAIGAAQAADLPMTKGEAVEYVKVCSAFGPGFFYIPGSDTCLKIGGEIRADYRAFGRSGDFGDFNRDDDRSAFNTQARIWFDAQTQTDWGLLRSYFQINADSHPISNLGRGGKYNSNTFSIDKAFIQFGGLTAGYAHSFFGFYDSEYGDTIWAPYYAQSSTVNLLAYTAKFGGGFSATLSIEDGRDHRVDGVSIPVTPTTNIALPFQGGQQIPDVVAQLRLDQSWGSIAVQGAVHQLRTAEGATITNPFNPAQSVGIGYSHDNKWGYAIGGTALFKIPAIDGGHFIVEGQYADGATHYLGVSNSLGSIIGQSDLYPSRLGPPSPGNIIDVASFGRVKGWSIVAELGGNITPVLNANLVGSYIETKADGILSNVLAGGVDIKVKEYTIAGNLTYTIVKGLSVAGEVAYTHQTQDFNTAFGGADGKENVWSGGVRLKRTF
ncbi:porin [Labrys sp. 22185]|uniref:porin n=1 Tax=Labrys sp. 22185 TaxID=3453888 RepID=UPI003F87B5E1